MSKFTRGIFGRKPAVAGSSDVFSLDTQYSSSVSGTWPVSGAASGKFLLLGSPYVTTTASIFHAYEKSAADGKYYPTGMLDTAPRGVTTTTATTSITTTPGGTHVAITSGTAFNTAQYIDIWKKSTTGLSAYQYLSTITISSGSLTPGTRAKFDPTGTYLAVGFSYGGSPPTPNRFRVWKRTGDTFTELSTPPDPTNNSSTSHTVNYVAWNADGTSVALAITVSPYLVIYNRSGDTFTKLSSPATLPSAAGVAAAWNPSGTSLAVTYNASPYLIIYNRSGDTFTAIAGTPTLIGTKTTSRGAISWSPDGSLLAIPRDGGTSGYIVVLSRSGDTFTSLSVPTAYGPGTTQNACLFLNSSELLVTSPQTPEIWDVSGTTISRPYAYKFGLFITPTPGLTGTAGYFGNPYNSTPGASGGPYLNGDVWDVVPIPGL